MGALNRGIADCSPLSWGVRFSRYYRSAAAVTVSASTRLYIRRFWIVALMSAGVLLGVRRHCGAASGDETPAAGTWQAHRYQFQYLSDNSTYSCSGLTDKLRLLLRTVDARDVHVTPVCLGNPGLPDRFATADLRFQTLTPEGPGTAAASAATTPGAWQHVVWTFEQPEDLRTGRLLADSAAARRPSCRCCRRATCRPTSIARRTTITAHSTSVSTFLRRQRPLK